MRGSLPRLAAFGIALLAAFAGADLLIERGAYLVHFQQSWISHFGAARSFEYGSAGEHPFDWTILVKNWDITVPAVAGVAVLLSHAPCLARRGPDSWPSHSLAKKAALQHPAAPQSSRASPSPGWQSYLPSSRRTNPGGPTTTCISPFR